MANKLTLTKPRFNIFKSDLKNLLVLIRKELNLFFNNTLAYIVISVSIILHFFLFFITGSFFAANQSDLTTYFVFMPWVFLILIPTLTMGSISNEEKEGTIEFILSKPVGTLELILSKILSTFLIVISVLAVEFLLLIPLLLWGNFDIGKIIAQYIGTGLLTLALTSFGVLVSSFARSQISAFLITAVGIFLGLLLGLQYVAIYFPIFLSRYLERMSLLSHYNSVLRGAIDVSDLLYFVGLTVFCLFATYYILMRRKLPKNSGKLTSVGIITLVGLIVVVLVTGFGQRIPGKLDLTKYKVNTLTNTSKTIVREAEEDVTLKLYYTDALPPQFQTTKRDLFNTIREYENASNGKLKVQYISTENEDAAQKATEEGIQPLRFQEQGTSNVTFSVGYLGMTIEYGDQKEVIPSVVETNNLEYEITGALKKLTVEDKKKIGILDTKVKHASSGGLSTLQQILQNEFDVVPVVFDEENRTIPEDISTLIIAGPNDTMSEGMRNEIRNFFNDGGAILFLSDPATEEVMSLTTTEVTGSSLNNFFEDLGVSINRNVVYDLQSYLSVNYQDSFLPVPYPFFPVAFSTYESPINAQIDGIGLRWASTVTIDDSKSDNVEITRLFTTSEYAGTQDIDGGNISPEQNWNQIEQSDLEQLLLAVSILEKDDTPGRAIVVGDSDLISNDGITSSQNAVFVLSSIEWLAQDESLASIKAKERVAAPLNLPFVQEGNNVNLASMVQFGGPLGLVALVALVGFIRNRIRKNTMNKVYVV